MGLAAHERNYTASLYESLSHSKWECKYHIVFVPKFRKKILYGKIKKFLAPIFHELANQKGCKIEKGNMGGDHVHMLISVPPKHRVSEIVGYIKGKSTIAVARKFGGVKRNYQGHKFWARGYVVSTVGFEVAKICEYIKNQERFDKEGGEF